MSSSLWSIRKFDLRGNRLRDISHVAWEVRDTSSRFGFGLLCKNGATEQENKAACKQVMPEAAIVPHA
jgi:hypothetical protein